MNNYYKIGTYSSQNTNYQSLASTPREQIKQPRCKIYGLRDHKQNFNIAQNIDKYNGNKHKPKIAWKFISNNNCNVKIVKRHKQNYPIIKQLPINSIRYQSPSIKINYQNSPKIRSPQKIDNFYRIRSPIKSVLHSILQSPLSQRKISYSSYLTSPKRKFPSQIIQISNINLHNQYNYKLSPPASSRHPQYQFRYDTITINIQDFFKGKLLGKGKFGQVYIAKHKTTGILCAMKIINKKLAKEERVQNQIAKQIRIHSRLNHPSILKFYGFFSDKENIYILMEYACGESLYSKLLNCYKFSQDYTSNVVKRVCQGLRFMHSLGYIHRDIKPENILLNFNTIKICDMGWTTQLDSNKIRQEYAGTPLYYSPQVVRKQFYDDSIDAWSIGILTYQLLIGRIPFSIFTEDDLPQILSQQVIFSYSVEISSQAKNFILSALEKDPHKRIKVSQMLNHRFLKKKFHEEMWDYDLFQLLRK